MSWASERRVLILAVIAGVVLIIAGLLLFPVLHQPPSCMDGKQNADETGIDCGGSCTYLCTASVTSPKVEFVRAVSGTSGRVDIVAYVENPNPDAAAKSARFHVELYGADRQLLAEGEGTTDLPSSASVPIFIPNFYADASAVTSVFLTFDAESIDWFRPTREPVIPSVRGTRITEGEMPRIVATLENPSADPLIRVPVIATVFDANGNAIAASRTIVNILPPQGTADLVFTWSVPFPASPNSIDVRPVISVAP